MAEWVVVNEDDDGEDEAAARAEAGLPADPGPCSDCAVADLEIVEDHPANTEDYAESYRTQGYRVFRCRRCGDLWGCRYQFDAGTGHDDRWHRFGNVDPTTIRRHY
jgi:hypothetical protein